MDPSCCPMQSEWLLNCLARYQLQDPPYFPR
uniref:Uncharacterized protein n=1 Tax=Arundo donax TaxID=35708 RepID=A0A0A9HDH8_ARUDO